MKKCCICKTNKNDFGLDKSRWDGLSATCRMCSSIRRKRHYENNKEITLVNNKQWKIKNKQKYRNSEARREKERTENDITFKLKNRLRSRVRSAIKRNQKSGSAIQDLGCSVEFLKQYLESLFQPGMSWDNWGFGKDKWNIDHIIPLSLVDLSNREEFLKVCHYTNLQPMWQLENFKKSNKIIWSK